MCGANEFALKLGEEGERHSSNAYAEFSCVTPVSRICDVPSRRVVCHNQVDITPLGNIVE